MTSGGNPSVRCPDSPHLCYLIPQAEETSHPRVLPGYLIKICSQRGQWVHRTRISLSSRGGEFTIVFAAAWVITAFTMALRLHNVYKSLRCSRSIVVGFNAARPKRNWSRVVIWQHWSRAIQRKARRVQIKAGLHRINHVRKAGYSKKPPRPSSAAMTSMSRRNCTSAVRTITSRWSEQLRFGKPQGST